MIRPLSLAIIAVITTTTVPALAAGFDPAQRKEIESIVRQYIMDNPSIVFEAADKHQANQQQKADDDAKKVLKDKSKELFENSNYAVLGNKKAKVPFVEFFDYNCGYCKQAYPDLVKTTDDDKNIKIVLVDTPILGPTSLTAAKWAIAAGKLGKYVEFHGALMNFQGPKDDENLTKLAKDVGLNPDEVRARAGKEDIQKQIDDNMALFSALGLSGTPGFAAPDRVIRGAVGPDVLKQIAKEISEKK